MGLATPQRVGSSRTRDQTHVPCIGFLSAVPSGKSQVGYFCLFEGIAPGGYLVHSSHYSGLPWWLDSKESACNVGDLGSIPGLGGSPGGGHGNPLQYSCLENPMGRGTWRVVVHGVSKSRTRLSDQAPTARSTAIINHGAWQRLPSYLPESEDTDGASLFLFQENLCWGVLTPSPPCWLSGRGLIPPLVPCSLTSKPSLSYPRSKQSRINTRLMSKVLFQLQKTVKICALVTLIVFLGGNRLPTNTTSGQFESPQQTCSSTQKQPMFPKHFSLGH